MIQLSLIGTKLACYKWQVQVGVFHFHALAIKITPLETKVLNLSNECEEANDDESCQLVYGTQHVRFIMPLKHITKICTYGNMQIMCLMCLVPT